MSAICMPCALRGQKRVLNPPKLELQMVVRCHLGPRNQT